MACTTVYEINIPGNIDNKSMMCPIFMDRLIFIVPLLV